MIEGVDESGGEISERKGTRRRQEEISFSRRQGCHQNVHVTWQEEVNSRYLGTAGVELRQDFLLLTISWWGGKRC
eukprot:492316-Hanusia_phi.AAC.1